MSRLTVGEESSEPIELYYEVHGTGSPVVLIHGWPLSGASWEKQSAALQDAGQRVVTYDRRGFGRSGRPTTGYDYDTLAEDLEKLLIHLDLRDVSLVGFSMGGGEVARYLGKYGSGRVKRAVFIAAITPCLLKSVDNPAGVDGSVFEDIRKALVEDRPAFLTGFFEDFFNVDVLGGKRVSEEVIQFSWNVAVEASAQGTLDCVTAWLTDFRREVAGIDVPVLILHGDADRILPIAATAEPLARLIPGSRLVVVKGGPHGLTWTHAQEVDAELVKFLAQPSPALKP